MEFSIKDLLSKCEQIHGKLRIWSHLMKKSLMEMNASDCQCFFFHFSFLTIYSINVFFFVFHFSQSIASFYIPLLEHLRWLLLDFFILIPLSSEKAIKVVAKLYKEEPG